MCLGSRWEGANRTLEAVSTLASWETVNGTLEAIKTTTGRVPSPPPLHQSPQSGDCFHGPLLLAMSSAIDYLPGVPYPTVAIPSLSDIPEEKSSTASSLEKQLNTPKRRRRRDGLKPGFYNRPPFKSWLKASWLDIATQLLCLLIAELIYLFATPLMPRYFPLFDGVWTSAWGLAHGKPYLAEYITTLVSAIISFAIPFLIMGAIGLWHVRDFWESNAAVSPSTLLLAFLNHTSTMTNTSRSWALDTPSQQQHSSNLSSSGSSAACAPISSPSAYRSIHHRYPPSVQRVIQCSTRQPYARATRNWSKKHRCRFLPDTRAQHLRASDSLRYI